MEVNGRPVNHAGSGETVVWQVEQKFGNDRPLKTHDEMLMRTARASFETVITRRSRLMLTCI